MTHKRNIRMYCYCPPSAAPLSRASSGKLGHAWTLSKQSIGKIIPNCLDLCIVRSPDLYTKFPFCFWSRNLFKKKLFFNRNHSSVPVEMLLKLPINIGFAEN